MLLQPSKFNYNTSQNSRSASIFSNSIISYGTVALVLLKPLRISANRIYSLNLFLNSSSRRSDTTNSSFWVAIFPHLPLSRNPNGMRMGNGAGKLATWYTQVSGGKSLVEFNNLRLGRALYYSRQVAHNLPVPTSVHQGTTKHLNLVQSRSSNPNMYKFW